MPLPTFEEVAAIDRRRFLRLFGGLAAGGAGIVAGTGLRPRPGIEDDPDDEGRHDATVRAAAAFGIRRFVWSGDTSEPFVALTFDDGPYPDFTDRTLEILDRYGIKATFNLMGVNAATYPDLVATTVARGHEIGNHTFSHVRLPRQTMEDTGFEIARGKEVIEAVAGVRARFFRPPWGQLTGAAARHAAEAGHDVLLWSVTRRVPGVGTPMEVVDNLVGQLHPGAIVLLHDGFIPGSFDIMNEDKEIMLRRRQVELAALGPFIEKAMEQGFRFATVSEIVDGDDPATGRA